MYLMYFFYNYYSCIRIYLQVKSTLTLNIKDNFLIPWPPLSGRDAK